MPCHQSCPWLARRRARVSDAITGARAARDFLCALTGPIPVTVAIETTPIHDALRDWHGPTTMILRLPKKAA